MSLISQAWPGSLEDGKRLLKEGKFKEAAEEFGREARAAERAPEANLLLGLALLKQNDIGKAEAALKEAVRLDLKSGEAHTLLGWLYLEGRRDPSQAIVEFQAAVRTSPNSPEAHNNLGTAYDRLRQFDRAIENYGRALALRPDYPQALSNRGWSNVHRRDLTSARTDFRSALAIDPNDSGAISGLAQLSKESGDLREAATQYRKLIAGSPNFIYLMDLLEVYVRQYGLVFVSVLVIGWIGHSLQKRRFRKKLRHDG